MTADAVSGFVLPAVKRASVNPSSPICSMMSVSLNQLKGLVENYINFFFQKCLKVGTWPSIYYKEIALYFFLLVCAPFLRKNIILCRWPVWVGHAYCSPYLCEKNWQKTTDSAGESLVENIILCRWPVWVGHAYCSPYLCENNWQKTTDSAGESLVENYINFFFQKCLKVGTWPSIYYKEIALYFFFAGLCSVFEKKHNTMQIASMGGSCVLLTLFV